MLVEGQNLSFFNTFFFLLIKTIFSNILEATLAVTCVNLHSYYCHTPSTEAITEITGNLLWHFLSNLFAIRQISTGMGTMQGPYMQGSYVQYPFVQGLRARSVRACVISLYHLVRHSDNKYVFLISIHEIR